MMNYTQTNGKKPECYAFSHFCHIGMPYDVLYLVPIVAKTTLPPATLSMLEFSHFLTLMMNYDKTNGNKSGYYGFLHFCHIDMPYSSVNTVYLIAIVATYYPAPSTPRHT